MHEILNIEVSTENEIEVKNMLWLAATGVDSKPLTKRAVVIPLFSIMLAFFVVIRVNYLLVD